MATYLTSLAKARASGPIVADAPASQSGADARLRAASLQGEGSRLYEGACASCHEADGTRLFGARPNLALNTSVFAASPENLIHVVLEGIPVPAHADLGAMPAFRDSLSDQQVTSLVGYLRTRFAPGENAWADLEEAVRQIRRGQAP